MVSSGKHEVSSVTVNEKHQWFPRCWFRTDKAFWLILGVHVSWICFKHCKTKLFFFNGFQLFLNFYPVLAEAAVSIWKYKISAALLERLKIWPGRRICCSCCAFALMSQFFFFLPFWWVLEAVTNPCCCWGSRCKGTPPSSQPWAARWASNHVSCVNMPLAYAGIALCPSRSSTCQLRTRKGALTAELEQHWY